MAQSNADRARDSSPMWSRAHARRPFAEAHVRELSALRNATTLDWAILAPPAGFGTGQGAEAEYRLIPEPVTRRQATAELTHALYARAVVAELTNPTVHQARVGVISLVG